MEIFQEARQLGVAAKAIADVIGISSRTLRRWGAVSAKRSGRKFLLSSITRSLQTCRRRRSWLSWRKMVFM